MGRYDSDDSGRAGAKKLLTCRRQGSLSLPSRPDHGQSTLGAKTVKIEGGCHCGAIRYEAVINPDYVVICHCSDCQAMSGATYRVNVPVSTAKLTLTGEPKRYVKIGGSGAKIVTTFCGTCGSPVSSSKGDSPRFVYLRLGGARQRADLPPKTQGFCASAMPWAWDIDAVRRVSEVPRENKPT
jgi:hypothetical protein